jgi:hypothetical protein
MMNPNVIPTLNSETAPLNHSESFWNPMSALAVLDTVYPEPENTNNYPMLQFLNEWDTVETCHGLSGIFGDTKNALESIAPFNRNILDEFIEDHSTFIQDRPVLNSTNTPSSSFSSNGIIVSNRLQTTSFRIGPRYKQGHSLPSYSNVPPVFSYTFGQTTGTYLFTLFCFFAFFAMLLIMCT